ncbi:receptor mediated endocytosis [Anaeramoeba flamelloides]|uniref:Receptor mediated endocytosis n=1 Tax=Anaeramoeba flamelloides TaxID=1746091 RepID=A0AAV7Z2I3_9EUKA|nr:receptor mediated endocytosis [Anaeramoeba flamelloides]KAJ6244840.1 receptor mediated endocytosis [Anaeramoeba flamelloides]
MFFEKFFILKHIIKSGKNELCLSYPTIKNDQDYRKVEPFCLTDLDELTKTNQKSQQTFSFVLTNTNGERSYGICRRIFTNSTTDIDCYVFITRHPLFSVFSRILAIIEVRNKIVKGAVIFFLKRLWKRSIPKRGTKFTLYIPAVYKIMPEAEFQFNRSDSSLADFDAERFFIMHDPKLIINLFTAVLFEKKIICSSTNLQRLTNALHTIAALVHPLTWPHVLIPIVPDSLLDTVNAPVPYILGIHSSLLGKIELHESENLVFCDLDWNRFEPEIQEFSLISSLTKNISKVLKKEKSKWQKTRQYNNKNAENAFLDFFIQIFADINHFMQLEENGEVRFSQNYWKSQKDPKIEKLLDVLVKTQIFQSFVESEEKKMKLNVNNTKTTTTITTNEIERELTPFEKHVKKINKDEEEQGFFIGLYPSNNPNEDVLAEEKETVTKNEEKVQETFGSVKDRLQNFIKTDSNINLKLQQNFDNQITNKQPKMEKFENNNTDIHKKIEELKKMYLNKNQKLNNYLQTSTKGNENSTNYKLSKHSNNYRSDINLNRANLLKKRSNTVHQSSPNLYNTKTSETLKKLNSPKLPTNTNTKKTVSSKRNLEIERILNAYKKKN